MTAVAAALCVLSAEYIFQRSLPVRDGLGALDATVLLLDVGVLWIFTILMLGITGSRVFSCAATASLTAVALIGNHFKTSLRAEPLFPTDVAYLHEVDFLLDSAGIPVWSMWVVVCSAVALVVLLVRRRLRRGKQTRLRTPLVLRGAYVALGLLAMNFVIAFNATDSPLRKAYADAGAEWFSWDQSYNYRINGFVAGMLYNMPTDPMEQPPGYEDSVIRHLADEYTATAQKINGGRRPEGLDDTNVVVVLSESFSDPTKLDGLSMSEDPIPFTRRLMSENPSGTLVSVGYGGGTANMEFELLTGLSTVNLQAQARTPFQSMLPGREAFSSFFSHAATPGHHTAAIHPFRGESYQRRQVYPVLGFDKTTFLPDMGHSERVGERADSYVSDESVFAEAMDNLRASEDPMMLNVVTMQNHLPYDDKYSDPIDAKVDDGVGDAALTPAVGQYLRGLRHSDDALRAFVEDINELNEPTVVLFYGDHLPPVWPQEVLAANDPLKQFETPWVIFGNVELEKLPDVGPIGPIYLWERLLAATDAPVSPLIAFLSELRPAVPALSAQVVLDEDGDKVSPAALSASAQALVARYRLIEYAQVSGADAVAGRFYLVPEE